MHFESETCPLKLGKSKTFMYLTWVSMYNLCILGKLQANADIELFLTRYILLRLHEAHVSYAWTQLKSGLWFDEFRIMYLEKVACFLYFLPNHLLTGKAM